MYAANEDSGTNFPVDTSSTSQVQPIVQAVKEQGDQAVRQFTEKFDRVQLDVVCSPIEVGVSNHMLVSCLAAFAKLHNVLKSAMCIRTLQNLNFQQKQSQPLKQLSTTSISFTQRRSRPFHYKWKPCLAYNVDAYPNQLVRQYNAHSSMSKANYQAVRYEEMRSASLLAAPICAMSPVPHLSGDSRLACSCPFQPAHSKCCMQVQ